MEARTQTVLANVPKSLCLLCYQAQTVESRHARRLAVVDLEQNVGCVGIEHQILNQHRQAPQTYTQNLKGLFLGPVHDPAPDNVESSKILSHGRTILMYPIPDGLDFGDHANVPAPIEYLQ